MTFTYPNHLNMLNCSDMGTHFRTYYSRIITHIDVIIAVINIFVAKDILFLSPLGYMFTCIYSMPMQTEAYAV